MSALQSPASPGADISEYGLEWGEDEESLELVYHGPDTCFEIRDLLPAAQYCCRLQVGEHPTLLPVTDNSLKGISGKQLKAIEEGSQGRIL